MKDNKQYADSERRDDSEERIEELAERLVDAVEFNAWEYGNTGNFMFN